VKLRPRIDPKSDWEKRIYKKNKEKNTTVQKRQGKSGFRGKGGGNPLTSLKKKNGKQVKRKRTRKTSFLHHVCHEGNEHRQGHEKNVVSRTGKT